MIPYRKYLLISGPSFTTYSSESEFIHKRYQSFFTSLGRISEGAILCTIDVVGLYTNIPLEEGLVSRRKLLDARTEKKVTTETLVELADIVLKNNIFQFNEKTLKQLRGTAIGTISFPHRMHFYLWLTSRKEFYKTLNCSYIYGGGILMIYFVSGNMKKIL